MIMQKTTTTIVALGLAGALVSGCGGGGGNSVTSVPQKHPAGYVQIERLARPAIKEVFEPFNDHKLSNAVEPYAGSPADPMPADIVATEDYVRPPNPNATPAATDYGKKLAGILYPDEYQVDLSQAGSAGYLGSESGGIFGGKFGGRDLTDDVVDVSLSALFGNALTLIGEPDDGEENNCLLKENLTQRPSQTQTATFPYFSAPH